MTDSQYVYVVIDVGCHECRVSSEGVGIYPTKAEAEAAAETRDEETGQWRDGGQTSCEIFAMELPGGRVAAGGSNPTAGPSED